MMTTVSSATSKSPTQMGSAPLSVAGTMIFQIESTVMAKESSARSPPGPANSTSSRPKMTARKISQWMR